MDKRCWSLPERCVEDVQDGHPSNESERGTNCSDLVSLDRVERERQIEMAIGRFDKLNYPTRNRIFRYISRVIHVQTEEQSPFIAAMRTCSLEIISKGTDRAEKLICIIWT